MRRIQVAVYLLAWSAIRLHGAPDPRLLTLIPPDTKALAGIHVQQGLATPFGRFLLSQIPDAPVIQQFAAASGFDFRKDLVEVLIAAQNPTVGATQSDRNLVLVRGTFDIAKLVTLANLTGGSATVKEGIQWLVPAQGPPGQSFAFLDSSLLLAGPPDILDAAIARRTTAQVDQTALIQKALTAAAGNEVWFASVTPVSELIPKSQPSVAPLEAILSYSGGLHMDDNGVTLSTEVVTKTPQDAQALATVLRFAAGMASNPKSLPLNQMQAETDGPTLRVKLSLPESQLEELIRQPARVQKVVAK